MLNGALNSDFYLLNFASLPDYMAALVFLCVTGALTASHLV